MMKLRKTFISPRVLETCEVALETNLLGASQQFMPNSTVETTGHQITEENSYENVSSWGNTGSWDLD